MSKIIKLTDEYRNEIRKEFDEALSKMKMSDGKITYTKTFGNVSRKATLSFTELAYLKMITLVREFDKEVAWHGLARRGDDKERDEYIVYDILVYPQEVTGSTVNTDQEKYQTWLMNHEDDVFNNIRMQGHSHVNMGTSPSTVDSSLYERILDQLDDDMFYIFLIWNKKNEKTIKIYDLAKNVLFETPDIDIKILEDGTGIERFAKAAKEMVCEKSYSVGKTSSKEYGGYGGFGYGGYGWRETYDSRYSYGLYDDAVTACKPTSTKNVASGLSKNSSESSNIVFAEKEKTESKRKKYKRKKIS